MKEIKFDTGIKTYQINDSGVLKFNPSDPNLYKRFKDLRVEIEQIQKDYSERSKTTESGEDAIDLLAEYDARVKKSLSHVFGEENDFDSILGGANVMAVASNGELVITNFLDAMLPIVEEGVKTYAKMEAQKAIQETNGGRK